MVAIDRTVTATGPVSALLLAELAPLLDRPAPAPAPARGTVRSGWQRAQVVQQRASVQLGLARGRNPLGVGL